MDRHDSQAKIRRDRLTDGLLTGDSPQDITRLSEADLERFKAEVRQVLVMLRPRAHAEVQSVRRINTEPWWRSTRSHRQSSIIRGRGSPTGS
jgi:hypothetical protein